MGEPRIRRLTRRDIDVAITLTELEHWGYTAADFERLLALSPKGCFAAEDAGRVVGVLTTTPYRELAFLGAVIVRPEYRGHGVGKLLMEAALDHLSKSGVETVRLNAYVNVIPFYERLGFHGEYEVIRWQGTAPHPAEGSPDIRRVRRDEVARVAAFDAAYFGASRRGLLERLFDETPETFLVAADRGTVQGYIVSTVSNRSCEVGPWVVRPDREGIARDLFGSLAGVARAEEYAFTGPSRNELLERFVKEARYHAVFRTLRMWWGKDRHPGDPTGVWAAGGLEKG